MRGRLRLEPPGRPGAWLALATAALLAGCGGGEAPSAPSASVPFLPAAQPPESMDDGWAVSTLEEEGIDLARVEEVSRRIQRGERGAIRSLLIVRNGKLAYEQYYNGGGRELLHELQSVTKSVTAVLVGLAVDRGLLADVEQPIEPFFPGYEDAFRADPAKADLRLRHLLTMTAGLDWDETTIPYTDARNANIAMNQSADWVGFVLSRRVVEAPGVRFNYTSGCPILLGEALRQVSGESPDRFAEDALFGPLGIQRYAWYRHPTHPSHLPHMGGGLSLRARDLAKIGEMHRSGGTWRGSRVLSEDWVRASSRLWAQAGGGVGYGFFWWLRAVPPSFGLEPAARDYGIVHGSGYGGQYVFTIPALRLVVVVNGQNYSNDPTLRVLYDELLPAVRPGG